MEFAPVAPYSWLPPPSVAGIGVDGDAVVARSEAAEAERRALLAGRGRRSADGGGEAVGRVGNVTDRHAVHTDAGCDGVHAADDVLNGAGIGGS